jgi:hypothetical protein
MVSKVIQCSCLRRREEGITPILEGERRMRDSSWFPREEATRGCNNAVVYGGGWQSELGDVWIDPRWKTTSRTNWGKRLLKPDTVVGLPK